MSMKHTTYQHFSHFICLKKIRFFSHLSNRPSGENRVSLGPSKRPSWNRSLSTRYAKNFFISLLFLVINFIQRVLDGLECCLLLSSIIGLRVLVVSDMKVGILGLAIFCLLFYLDTCMTFSLYLST